MTALPEYDRLECTGIWRPDGDQQRRDVMVAFGDATLVISDQNNRALTHWSLPAVERLNVGERPAVFSPDGLDQETLEIAEDTMIDAIEKVRKTVAKRKPRPGRLRLVSLGLSIAAVAFLGLYWLPPALKNHTVTVVPEVKRVELGETLFDNITRVSGPACKSGFASQALEALRRRLDPITPIRKIEVVKAGVRDIVNLPGGLVVINAALLEDHEDPAVAAGYILAQQSHASEDSNLLTLLDTVGLKATFKLLTTGSLPDELLSEYAEVLLTSDPIQFDQTDLIGTFEAAEVASTPFAYAVDISGETTLQLIEADPFLNTPPTQIISDSQWLQLQGICGG